MQRPTEELTREQLWKYYGVGVPTFVPAEHKEAVARCCDGIVKYLNEVDPVAVGQYEADQKGQLDWRAVLHLAVIEQLVSEEDEKISLSINYNQKDKTNHAAVEQNRVQAKKAAVAKQKRKAAKAARKRNRR